MSELKQAMGRMFRNYIGPGSTLGHTQNFRKQYPEIIKKYNIQSVNDAGCGLGWVKDVADIEYKGFDILKRPDATILDFTKEVMPKADLILCRDTLMHLPEYLILESLRLFKESKATFLLASSHYDADNRKIAKEIGFLPYNQKLSLVHKPYDLGEPLEKIEEPLDNRFMGLWKLN